MTVTAVGALGHPLACRPDRACVRGSGKRQDERSGGTLNRSRYPSDVIGLVMPQRLGGRLRQPDLADMVLPYSLVLAHVTLRE